MIIVDASIVGYGHTLHAGVADYTLAAAFPRAVAWLADSWAVELCSLLEATRWGAVSQAGLEAAARGVAFRIWSRALGFTSAWVAAPSVARD